MSVYITIQQHCPAKNVSMNDIVSWLGLSYGVMDGYFVIEENKIGDTVTFYDSQRIGRGFDCYIKDQSVELTMNLPNTGHDIDMFYQAARTICEHLKVKEVLMEDEEAIPFSRFPEFIKNDKDASVNVLKHLQKKAAEEPDNSLMISCARNPVFFNKKQFDAVNGDPESFEELLHELQCEDHHYSEFEFYQSKSDGSIIGVLFVEDGVLSVVPTKPEKPMGWKHEVRDYYVDLPGRNAVPLQVFIDNVEAVGQYDANRLKVCLDERQINEIISKGTVDVWTNEAVPCVPYHRDPTAK